MIEKIFFFAFISAVAWAQGNEESLKILKNLTQAGIEKISKAEISIGKAKENFDGIAKDRLDCLHGEYHTQKKALNATIIEAVFKGMLKNKQFSNFQCITNAGQETFDKLDALRAPIPENYERIREKRLAAVYSYKSVLTGLLIYVDDFYKNKYYEIINSKKEETTKKIMAEVEGKMKLFGSIVDQIQSNVNSSKFQFFEEFVNFAHKTDNDLRKTQREGAQKVMFCVF